MRSAERLLFACLAAALCIAGSGCASIGDLAGKLKPASSNESSPPAAAAAAQGKATGAAADADVDPAVRRDFEAARSALLAGRVDEAQRGFLALAQAHPELGGPHANLGVIYRQAGKLPEAVAELEAAVKANPRQAVYRNQLGIAYRAKGDFQKAREAYEQAIAIDPNYAIAYLNLGILYDLYFWESKKALELYDHYLALSPNGDPQVTKWVADLKNRTQQQNRLSRKEQP
ncbi:MAG TPA: tetratricopeptide repeat protein [Burkholderiaceae bacterium]|nr:tetratricopeptide repeat protein [Burkholderiaceae bacterium]